MGEVEFSMRSIEDAEPHLSSTTFMLGSETLHSPQQGASHENMVPSPPPPPPPSSSLPQRPWIFAPDSVVFLFLLAAWARLLQYIRQNLQQVKHRKFSYVLGFLCCFTVVVIAALVGTLLVKAPVFFLRVAEVAEGEADVALRAHPTSGHSALNYTAMARATPPTQARHVSYHAPRLFFEHVPFFVWKSCRTSQDVQPPFENMDWAYEGLTGHEACAQTNHTRSCPAEFCALQGSLTVRAFDHEREERMGLGREWKPQRLARGELAVDVSVTKLFPIAPGDRVLLRVSVMLTDIMNITQSWQNVFIPMTVAAIYEDAGGKIGSGDEALSAFLDYETLWPLVMQHVHPQMDEDLRAELSSRDLFHFASDVFVNLPPNRIETYLDSDFDLIQKRVLGFSAELVYRLGFNVLSIEHRILNQLSTTRFFALFLGLVLNVILVISTLLSIVLISSLLMVNVEMRTFELGVMRIVGMNRVSVVQLILVQALLYALPSWALGLIAAEIFSVLFVRRFSVATGVTVDESLESGPILWASVLGLLIPLFASIFPIRKALHQNLHDSLDVRRSRTKAVEFSIERSEDKRVPWGLLVLGSALAIFGFLIYYLFPLSLLAENITLLLYIFFGLLMGMLLGLVILSLNFEHLLERLLVLLCFWWENSAVSTLIVKNLVAHRIRNRKTSVMFSLSIAFVVFIAVSARLQIVSEEYRIQQEAGVRLYVRSATSHVEEPADENTASTGGGTGGGQTAKRQHVSRSPQQGRSIQQDGDDEDDNAGDLSFGPEIEGGFSREVMMSLERLAKEDPAVASFTWVTQRLRHITEARARIEHVGKVYKDDVHVYGVAPNIFETSLPAFLNIGGSNKRSHLSLGEQLYTERGSQSLLVGTTYRDMLNLDLKSRLLLETGDSLDTEGQFLDLLAGQTSAADKKYPALNSMLLRALRPLAFLDTAPGFYFSKFPNRHRQDVLVSYTTFLRLIHQVTRNQTRIMGVEDIPMRWFKIQLAGGASNQDIDRLVDSLSAIAPNEEVWDFRDDKDALSTAVVVLDYIFGFCTGMAMFYCFFSLMTSMYTNINEQVKEIGIMRAIGLRERTLMRIYVYEAFTLVMAASLTGITIGTIVGWSMVLQRALFTQLPIPFVFPTSQVVVVCIGSTLFAFLSSYGPARRLTRKPIFESMRILT